MPPPPTPLLAPPAAAGRPDRWAGPRAVTALVVRELAERRSLRLPLLMDLVFGVLNLLLFLFISRVLTVPPDAAGFAHSARYFDFVAVGITFMVVVQAASTQVTGRIVAEQRAGTLEMLAGQPVPLWALAAGLAGYPFLVALLRAGVYLALLATLLGLRVERADWVGVVVVLLLGGVSMAGVGIGLMAFTVATGHGDAAARLLVVALAFLSGTYFPVAALPPALAAVTGGLPSRVALDGLRHALAGADWAGAALTLAGAAAVLLPLSIWIFGRTLRRATDRGTLTRA